MFGHINNDSVNESRSYLGYEVLRGTMNPCNSYRESKIKKEPIPKISERKPSIMPNHVNVSGLGNYKETKQMHNWEENT